MTEPDEINNYRGQKRTVRRQVAPAKHPAAAATNKETADRYAAVDSQYTDIPAGRRPILKLKPLSWIFGN